MHSAHPTIILEHKLVADTMNGSEMHRRRGISFELLSQMEYLIVHRPKMPVFADVLLKFLARDDISVIPQQKLKEPKITERKRNQSTIPRYLHLWRVHNDVVENNNVSLTDPKGSPHRCAHTGNKFRSAKWLGYIVTGANLQELDLRSGVRISAKDDDRS